MKNIIHNYKFHILALFVFAATFIVYLPGLSGNFLLDDYVTFVDNDLVQIDSLNTKNLVTALFSGDAGPLQRPISMLSFAINYYATGLSPFSFKLVNLIIHLLVGISLFLLSYLLLFAYQKQKDNSFPTNYLKWMALAITSAWLLHPINLTTVLYPTQRMTSLSALFAIWALITYLWGRLEPANSKIRLFSIVGSLLFFLCLSVLSKENGALTIFYIYIIEFIFFRFKSASQSERNFLYILHLTLVGIPLAVFVIYIGNHTGHFIGNYSLREYTLSERVMTEFRVIWFYLQMILIPNLSQFGLFHDDITISRSLIEPLSTITSAIGLLFLLVLAIIARKRIPIFSFGILFFLAGHSMESSIFALDIAHEHRNYLPSYGVLFSLLFYLLSPAHFANSLRARKLFASFLIGALILLTTLRAGVWGNPVKMAISEVNHHPSSASSNIEAAVVYGKLMQLNQSNKSKLYELSKHHFDRATSLNPNTTLGLFGRITLDSSANITIEESIINELAHRLEQAPFDNSNGKALVDLVDCHKKGICKIEEEKFHTLIESALNNQTIGGKRKAATLFAWTDYLANVKHDFEEATKFAKLTAHEFPSLIQYRLNYVSFLIALNKLDEAKLELELARKLDVKNIYYKKIREIQNLVTTRLANQ